jgi:RHS repeat-associated protein
VKRGSDRRALSSIALIPPLAFTLLLLSAPTAFPQEIVDPRSGQLVLSLTDLALQAGPVTLEVRRALQNAGRDPGLLGTRWRLNWESRLIQAGPLVLIEEMAGGAPFTQEGARGEYKSATGDRLVFEKSGRAIRTKLDRTKEIFDAQGRLVERDYRNGNRVVLSYGANGRLTGIDGPHGSFLRFTISKAGRLTQVEASTTATVRYGYQGDDLTEVQRPPAPPTRYSYFKDGRLSRIEEPAVGSIQFAYDFKGRVMSRRWADGSKERYEYDDKANRLRHTDSLGGVTTTQWSQDGRRQEVTDALGRRSVLEHDGAGRPVSVTGPTGATSRLTYDALGRTVTVTNPVGQVTKFEYLGESSLVQAITQPGADRQVFEHDPHGNLTAIRIGSETVTTFTYHQDGSIATTSGRGTPKQAFTYHPDGRLKSMANALGETTQFEYDRRGNVIREINPLGGVTTRTYDAQDRVLSQTTPVAETTRYEYDKKGRLMKIIDPSGAITRFEYDARARLVAETGPTGLVTKYEYDAAGREVKVIEPGNRVTTRSYDALGNLTGLTDPLGRTTQFEYDQLGRLARERRPTGLEITYRYDGLGNLLGIEDNTGAKSEQKRDASGLLTSTVDPLGAVTRYQYDPLGNMVSLTDPAGHLTRYTYAQVGALASARLPSGDEGRYEYDPAGRLVALRRPSGGVTRVAYDPMGNITAMSNPLGNKRQQSYGLTGRLASSTDATGRVTGYVYDRSGRLAEKQLPDGRKVKYEYDTVGNRVKADDGAFPVLFRYDKEARLIGVEYSAIKKSVRYGYDSSGLKTKLIYADGREIRYGYDTTKRLSAIVLPDGKQIALAYDLKDRLSSVQYPNGVTGQWEYDAAGRIVKISYRDRAGNTVAGFSYRYDSTGNPIERQDGEGRTTRFQYDSAGQLVEEVSPGGTTRFRYLPGGNRAAVEERGTVTQFRYDADDRLVQVGIEQLTYDKNGNLIGRKGSSGSTAYEYDAEERLVKVVGLDGGATTFGYAPTSERVWKKDQQGLTYYLYDGFDLIQEIEEGGSVKATYVHGPGIDRPLVMIRDGKTYYYHGDRLGSVTHLSDEQGQIVASYEYDPFGKMRERRGSIQNPFTFTGREFDSTTGLYYYRARYYDATLGRFLAPDPAAPRMDEPLELNPYLYVRNSPVRFVDPLGLEIDPGIWQWYGERAIERMRARLENYGKPGQNPDPYTRAELEARLRGMEAEVEAARARGVQAKPPPGAEPPPPPRATEGSGRPRTPTIKVQQPQAGQTGAVPRPGAPGSQTAAVPRPGAPTPEAPGPGGSGGGISRGAAGTLAVVMTAAQLYNCYERGLSPAQCATEIAVGLAVGGVVVAVIGPTGALVLTAASGLVSIKEGVVELNQDWKDWQARRQAEQAREAQQRKNFENMEEIISKLEQQIDGQLAALRGQIAGAVAGAKGAAQSAANAATAASNLLSTLKGYGPQIAQASTACKEVEGLMSQVQAAASNAARYAELADAAFTLAGAMVDACQSKDELKKAHEAHDSAKHLASGAASNYRRAQEAFDKLNAIRAQSASARSALGSGASVLGKIAAEVSSASSFAGTARTEEERAMTLFADLKARKAAMLTQVGNIRNVFPPDTMQQVDQRLSSLVGRLTVDESPPTASASANWADREVVRATGILGQAEALLGEFKGLALCDQVVPPSIDDAARAVANLGLGGMGEGFDGKAAACLAKLTPGQAPATTAGGDKPPTDPTLTSFGVSCSPSKITVGQSASCKAVGEYSTQPGVAVDLTHLAAWGPGPTIIGDWPGSWFARASHGGKSATATVTVVAADAQPPPDVPGATQAGSQFQGQQPGGKPPAPTSGATGGGQPVDQPGLKPPPASGSGETGTPAGQPPQQGIVCYSEKTKEYYTIQYGPCPPPHMKPPTGSTAGGEPGRIPWQGLVPGQKPPMGQKPPTGGGPCPPGCHLRPDGSGCHCPQTAGPTPGPTGGPATLGTPQKPPGPGIGSPAVASGQNCDPPLCTRRGQTDCQEPRLGPDPKPGDWEKKCYENMLRRCNQGMSGRTGGWCVRKGADASCEARAERVCGCDPVMNPRCGGKWE